MRKRTIVLAVVAVVAVIAGAAVIGNNVASDIAGVAPPSPQQAAPPLTASPQRPKLDLVRAAIGEAQVSIAYPRGWKRLPTTEDGVGLLVADGSEASLLVRVAPVGLIVTPETVSVARTLTDSLVTADGRIDLLEEPGEVLLGGLPGYRYRYRFLTADGKPGVHVHYFLFKKGQLVTLVFQVLPASRLEALSDLIDQMALTFRGR